jgi:head-tail adaptor
MLAGKLDKKITLQSGSTVNQFGDVISTYSDASNHFATVTIKSVKNEDDLVSYVTNFYMRYTASIDYSYRIKYDNELYKILTIQEIGRKEALSINAVRIENS